MPRGTERQSNAQDKALETLSNLVTTVADEEKEPVTPTAQVIELQKSESSTEKAESKKKTLQVQEDEVVVNKKAATDDFFDYLARLQLTDFTAPGACVYVYKQAQSGNVQLDRIYRPLTFEELKNGYAARHGAGNYYVQFTTRNKNLSSCGQRFTFDGDSLSVLGESSGSSVERSTLSSSAQATSEAIKMVAEASREANKANIELITQITKDNIRPQTDSVTPLIITMMENQRKEAAERAERDRKEAIDRAEKERKESDERAKRDLQAANDRAERDNKFFQLLMDNGEKRASERAELIQKMNEQQTKFFEALLKEKEKKEDSLGMGDVLKELFGAFARERLEGGGNETLPGWAGVVQTALPKVADAVSTFMAVRAGASPQQIQQLQAAQVQQSETAHGPNGQQLNPAPVSPLQTADQQLVDFINRLGNYVSSHENPDPSYMLTVINEEYGPIEDWIYRTPADQIIQMLQNNPLGQRLLAIPNAPPFIEALIAGIKTPEAEEQQPEPEVIPAQQYAVREPKLKKRKSAAN